MSKLIVLRGNSGSGKTTISKALQKRFGRNTMLIAQDVIRMQMLNAKDIEALPLIIDLIKYGKQNSDIMLSGKLNDVPSVRLFCADFSS